MGVSTRITKSAWTGSTPSYAPVFAVADFFHLKQASHRPKDIPKAPIRISIFLYSRFAANIIENKRLHTMIRLRYLKILSIIIESEKVNKVNI